MALTRMAVRRGALIGEIELGVYSEDLMEFELADIHATLNRIGQKVPAEFESPLLPGATIVAMVRQQWRNRITRIRPEQLRPEVRDAIARTEEYKRLEARGALVHEPLQLPVDALAMERKDK